MFYVEQGEPVADRKRRKISKTWQYVGLALLAAVTIVGVVAAFNRFPSTPVAVPQSNVNTVAEETPEGIVLNGDEPLRVLFSGDSLSAGWYATTEDQGFRPLVQAALQKQGEFTFEGTYREGDRVQDIADSFTIPGNVDLAIVELGTNDVTKNTDPAVFRDQYDAYLDAVLDASPDAQHICLGVFAAPDEAAQKIDNHIADVCQEHDGEYIEIKDLYTNDSLRGPAGAETWLGPADNGHPNDEGHARIAERVLSAITIV